MSTATIVQPDTVKVVANLKASTNQTALTNALAFILSAAITSRAQLPVLAGVLIEGHRDSILVSGFDYEVSATEKVAGSGSGRALVSARLLQDIVKSLSKACDVSLSVKVDRLTITGDDVTYTVPLLPLEDFPALPALPSIAVGTLTQAQLADIFDTATAAGRDGTLPVLTGIRFEPEVVGSQATLVVAATDRYRLAVCDSGAKVSKSLDPFLLPAPSVVKVKKAFKGDVRVKVTPGNDGAKIVSFDDATRTLTMRNLEGEFPKYRSLLPDSAATTVVIDAKALTTAVRQVALVASRTSPVRLVIADNGVKLEAGGLDDAEAEKQLDATVEGEALTIAFNPSYLLDGIAAIGTKSVQISLRAGTKPAVLSGVGRPDFRYLLMPVRLAG